MCCTSPGLVMVYYVMEIAQGLALLSQLDNYLGLIEYGQASTPHGTRKPNGK